MKAARAHRDGARRATGELIGAGLIDVTGPNDPIGELAALATAEQHRRRGIAGAISAFPAKGRLRSRDGVGVPGM